MVYLDNAFGTLNTDSKTLVSEAVLQNLESIKTRQGSSI